MTHTTDSAEEIRLIERAAFTLSTATRTPVRTDGTAVCPVDGEHVLALRLADSTLQVTATCSGGCTPGAIYEAVDAANRHAGRELRRVGVSDSVAVLRAGLRWARTLDETAREKQMDILATDAVAGGVPVDVVVAVLDGGAADG